MMKKEKNDFVDGRDGRLGKFCLRSVGDCLVR